MYDVAGELTVTLITFWLLQKLGKDWQSLNKQMEMLWRKI